MSNLAEKINHVKKDSWVVYLRAINSASVLSEFRKIEIAAASDRFRDEFKKDEKFKGNKITVKLGCNSFNFECRITKCYIIKGVIVK